MMTEEMIRNFIRSQMPFLAVTPQHDILARYVLFGPVFRWRRNQMIPVPLQGDDLIWWLHAAAEEGRSLGDGDDTRRRVD